MKNFLNIILIALITLSPICEISARDYAKANEATKKRVEKELKQKGYSVKDNKICYFYIKNKEGKWGICEYDGNIILYPTFKSNKIASVALRREFLFYDYEKSYNGLFDKHGNMILPGYSEIDHRGDFSIVKHYSASAIYYKDTKIADIPMFCRFTQDYTLGDNDFLFTGLRGGTGKCFNSYGEPVLEFTAKHDEYTFQKFVVTSPIATLSGKRYFVEASGLNGHRWTIVDENSTAVAKTYTGEIDHATACEEINGKVYIAYGSYYGSSELVPRNYIFKKGENVDYGIKYLFDENGREIPLYGSLHRLPNKYFYTENSDKFILYDPYFNKVAEGEKFDSSSNNYITYGRYEKYMTFRGEPINPKNPKDLALAKEHAKPTSSSTIINGNKSVVKELPSLDIVAGSIRFIDLSGNNFIEANGSYTVEFKVTNKGKGNGYRCMPKVSVKNSAINITGLTPLDIKAGETRTVRATVKAAPTVGDGAAEFALAVDEANGFGTDTQYLKVATRPFLAPMVVVNDYTLSGTESTLERKVPFNLDVLVQNIEQGQAEDVNISIKLPQNVYIVDGEESNAFATLAPGASKQLSYTLVANNRFTGSEIPIEIAIKEKHGKYSRNRTINLAMSQPLAASKIEVDARQRQNVDIEIRNLTSEVDRDIPTGTVKATNTFAVVISNENYREAATVPYALNDGQVFAKYCTNILGIPAENIRMVSDASRNDMLRHVKWLCDVGKAYGNEANIIFYYSGHGLPSESDRQSYLMPVDGYHSDMNTNVSLDGIYRQLGETGAKAVTVFLDACFSGSVRGDEMLASARGVRLKAKAGKPNGAMVVFAACQGEETAYPLAKEGHGMFTYYLLRKLRETKGDISLGDLADYLTTEVSRRSLIENSKSQQPNVSASPQLSDTWRSMKLY